MNLWLVAGGAVTATLIPCAAICLFGNAERRLVGLEMTSIMIIFALVLFTVAFDRLPLIDLALTAAIMSFGGGIVFARFLEKHL